MPFVVDASMAACWLMPDEFDETALSALGLVDEGDVIAPALWWFDVRNLLVVNERRGRLSAAQSEGALAILQRLKIGLDRFPDELTIMRFARKHRLTVYDAAYLELAWRKEIPLATLDRRLAEAARAEKITLLDTPA
jgi:predicted nucleic acid-binding protein